MRKRLVSMLLAILMMLSLVPAVLAEGEGEQPAETPAEAVSETPPEAPAETPAETVSENPPEAPAETPEEEQPTGDAYIEQINADPTQWPKTMYVYTENGFPLNVRSEPAIRKNNKIGEIEFGAEVIVEGYVVVNTDWSVIRFKKGPDGLGYVMNRFLVAKKPVKSQKQKAAEKKANDDKLNEQLSSAQVFEKPFMAKIRATRTSGWINFRVGPAATTQRIASLEDGHSLKVVGMTKDWYQVVDMVSGKTGYVHKSYVTAVATPVPEEKQQLGRLSVNGDFALQCALPEGYQMQTVTAADAKIITSITSEDKEKPILYLSIAYNELYSDVARLNDLGEEDLKLLEESFTEMNDVELSYRETAYGTKLLVARETGSDTDFVDILTVYKGYSIEFVMTPNPEASVQELTDAQIQMCVDFLSELDFVEVK